MEAWSCLCTSWLRLGVLSCYCACLPAQGSGLRTLTSNLHTPQPAHRDHSQGLRAALSRSPCLEVEEHPSSVQGPPGNPDRVEGVRG